MREEISYFKGNEDYVPYRVYLNGTEIIHEFIHKESKNEYITTEKCFINKVLSGYYRKMYKCNEKLFLENVTNDIKAWRKYTQECIL